MLNEFDADPVRERVIVALDCPRAEALALARQLEGEAAWVKVGMTLYYACGPDIVTALKNLGFKVFLDLKLHDIPHQVEGAAAAAAHAGADMISLHASGGLAMMQAARRGVEDACAQDGRPPAVTLGITVLTSMDASALAQVGIDRAPIDQVEILARVAKNAGVSGVVASPREARMLRELLGQRAYIVTPGVRPAGSERGDQSRTATPAEAFSDGASHIVVGRPITQAPDPLAAFQEIIASCA